MSVIDYMHVWSDYSHFFQFMFDQESCLREMFAVRIMLSKALKALFIHCHSNLTYKRCT